MLNQRTFAGTVGAVGSGRFLYTGSLFLLHIGFARSLGRAGYGSFQQVFIFNMLFLVFSLGIPETLYYFLPRLSEEEKGAFLGQTIMLLLAAAVGVAALLWFGAPFFAGAQGNPEIAAYLRYFGIYGAFFVLSSFADPVFITYQRVRYLFLLSSAHALFFVILTALRWADMVTVEDIFAAMMVFGSFKCLAALWLLYHIRGLTGPLRFTMHREPILIQLSFALPVALTTTIEQLSRWLDKIVVSFFLGTEPLGLFSIGAIEIPFVGLFVSSVFSVVSPVLNELEHKGDEAGFRALLKKVLSFNAKVIWPIALYLFVFADHLLPLVFTGDYQASVPPFRLYLVLMPFRILIFGVVIIALGRPRIVLFGAAGSLAVNLVLNVVLVKWIGFLGPAIATVVSTLLQVAFMFWYILSRLGTGFAGIVPVKKLLQIGFSAVSAGALAWFLTQAYSRDLKAVLSSLTIMTGAYIFVGSRFGLFHILSFGDLLRGRIIEKRDQHQDD